MDECPLNLLDLPDLVLEEIFKYCLRSLNELKLCCRFIKDFIDTHSRLKRPPRNELSIEIVPKLTRNEVNHYLLKNYEPSKIYDSVKFTIMRPYGSDCFMANRNLEVTHPVINVKMILDKHAEEIQELSAHLYSNLLEDASDYLIVMKSLTNLQKVNASCSDICIPERDRSAACRELNFPKLKFLDLRINNSFLIKEFQNSSNFLEKLKLQICGPLAKSKNYETLFNILRHCKNSLKDFTLKIDNNSPKDEFNKLLGTLSTIGLDLQKFSIANEYMSSWKVSKVFKLIKNQTNLRELIICETGDEVFEVSRFRDDTSTNSQNWKMGNLEKIEISCWFGSSSETLDRIFHFPSRKLKEIILHGNHDYGGQFFKKISQNYKSVMKLDIGNLGINYSSNDIFPIMQYLKKLKHLKFTFPPESALDEANFDGPDNLMLPEIEKVDFEFNDSITNEHLLKLLQLMTSLKELTFSGLTNSNNNQSTLEIAIKELPHLNHLRNYTRFLTSLQDLEAMKEIVENYNLNPKEFKFNGQMIQDCIDREKTKEKLREGRERRNR